MDMKMKGEVKLLRKSHPHHKAQQPLFHYHTNTPTRSTSPTMHFVTIITTTALGAANMSTILSALLRYSHTHTHIHALAKAYASDNYKYHGSPDTNGMVSPNEYATSKLLAVLLAAEVTLVMTSRSTTN